METIKTAISINKNLFDQAEELAREMHVSRSRLFVLALEAFLKKNENEHLLEQLNNLYNTNETEDESRQNSFMKAKQRELIQGDVW
ncbi:MAG: CopG family transcriptional regulator [SAR324 cluster bacterium]|nr:CopG family transcriptional regulator [SAR324 cluster bacterium]